MARARRFVVYLAPLVVLAACATSPEGRSQLVAPAQLQGLSAVYSEFDMRLQLVTAADAPSCGEADCVADRAFDQRILAIGQGLATVAYRQYPDLFLRFPRFEFIVADKADPGTASSAGGTVVVYRGVRQLDLDDGALALVLAREMCHVIGGHHDENVTASILVAVAAQILLPVLNLAQGIVAAVSSSAAATTTLTTTAVASAASFAGSQALRASYRPQQVREAEAMAMKLLAAAGWDGREVSDQLEAIRPALPGDSAWLKELRESTERIAGQMQGPMLPESQLADAPRLQIAPELALDGAQPMVSAPF